MIKEDSEEKEQFDPRAILANLPPLPALEAFNKHRDFLANSQNLLAGLGGHGRIPFTSASGILGFQPTLIFTHEFIKNWLKIYIRTSQ